MYRYDEFDQQFVAERVAQFRRQVKRRLAGELDEDQFRPLRLMNGLYLQLHAYMLRVNVPYGTLSSKQIRTFAHIARKYDRNFGHFTTRQNIQYTGSSSRRRPTSSRELAKVEITSIQSSAIASVTSRRTNTPVERRTSSPIRGRIASCCANTHSCTPNSRTCRANSRSRSPARRNDRAAVAVHDIGLRMHKNAKGESASRCWSAAASGAPLTSPKRFASGCRPSICLSYVEAILRVYNMHGRRDNIHKARIKIIVNQMGIDKYRELVDREWELTKNGALKVPTRRSRVSSKYFAPPVYEQLADQTAELVQLRTADKALRPLAAAATSSSTRCRVTRS